MYMEFQDPDQAYKGDLESIEEEEEGGVEGDGDNGDGHQSLSFPMLSDFLIMTTYIYVYIYIRCYGVQ